MTTPTGHDGERHHDEDGIREHDNPLPGWWVWLFVVMIIFSGGYFTYDQFGPGRTIISKNEMDVTLAAGNGARRPPSAVQASEAQLRRLQHDAHAMASARDAFIVRCAACHGQHGQGLIGPNLADDFWLHGGTLPAIRQTIADGIPEKGMVTWKGQLEPEEIEAIAAFVGTLRGTKPPNPKSPQGEPVGRDMSTATLLP